MFPFPRWAAKTEKMSEEFGVLWLPLVDICYSAFGFMYFLFNFMTMFLKMIVGLYV